MFVKQTVNVIVSHTHYLEEACWVAFLTSLNASICAHLWRWLFQHHPQEIKWTFYRKWKLVSCPLISSKPFIQQEHSWYWFVRVVCFKKKSECMLSGNKKFCCKFCSSVFSIFLTVFIVFFLPSGQTITKNEASHRSRTNPICAHSCSVCSKLRVFLDEAFSRHLPDLKSAFTFLKSLCFWSFFLLCRTRKDIRFN